MGLRPSDIPIHRDLADDDIRRIVEAWQADLHADRVTIGALLYRLRHALIPIDLKRLKDEARRRKYRPPEYAGIILG